MKKIHFNDYIENYIANLKNVNDKAKANFFIAYLRDYLAKYMGPATLDSPDIFSVMDKNFLLDSIEFYLNEIHPAKGVAEDYRRTIIELCKNVCSDYTIKNNFLESTTERSDFHKTTTDLFSSLKESESRECLPFEEFEILDSAIRKILSTDIVGSKSTEYNSFNPDFYKKLVSAIALRLVQKYGLANDTIPNLKIADLNMEDQILTVKGFQLYLSDELICNFALYLQNRAIVIKNNNVNADTLFITIDGEPYLNKNGHSENGKLFSLMKDALGHTKVTGLRYRTIVELVSKGANIHLLSQLTKVTESTIGEICNDDRRSLENIFRGTPNSYVSTQKIQRKGQMQCPYCGNYKNASAENWILIQIAGDERKYLACRECRGLDGKYRY